MELKSPLKWVNITEESKDEPQEALLQSEGVSGIKKRGRPRKEPGIRSGQKESKSKPPSCNTSSHKKPKLDTEGLSTIRLEKVDIEEQKQDPLIESVKDKIYGAFKSKLDKKLTELDNDVKYVLTFVL